jgi:calcium-dependent protein kinase
MNMIRGCNLRDTGIGVRSGNLRDIGDRVEARMGKIPISGRYHYEPRKFEDDYAMCDSVLGSGCNGEVKLATSMKKPGQRFAVKSFQFGGGMSKILHQEKLRQLKHEVENYLCMDHPHIARLYDVYETRHGLHLVMECMEGGELFDRVIERKQFSEAEARQALRQMLLALNYIHSHGIVHRDVKLENFIYDRKNSGHLKLIDFGFSKMFDPRSPEKMSTSLGTISYVAPEVLRRSYTSQCDMWSLGVIGFILLSGYMPFSANSDEELMKKIQSGKPTWKPLKWDGVSTEAREFIFSLLEVDPNLRLTAHEALQHPWITKDTMDDMCGTNELQPYCEALRDFSKTSNFRRCCLEVLAWSLSNDDRAKVREYFLALDESNQGTITLQELKHIMVDKLGLVDENEVLKVFSALDYNNDKEIHYSDFLAAMVNSHIDLSDELLQDAFRRLDADGSGYITAENLRLVLGSKVKGDRMEAFIAEADQNRDGRLSLQEFIAYLTGAPLEGSLTFGEGSNTVENASVTFHDDSLPASNPEIHKRRRSSFQNAFDAAMKSFQQFYSRTGCTVHPFP